MARNNSKIRSKSKSKKYLFPLWVYLTGLVLVLVSIWAMTINNQQTKADIVVKGEPRLKIEKTVIDRGNVKLGTPVRDDIRVTNIGDQPLRFTEAPYVEVLEGC